jgi:hypothetical protein
LIISQVVKMESLLEARKKIEGSHEQLGRDIGSYGNMLAEYVARLFVIYLKQAYETKKEAPYSPLRGIKQNIRYFSQKPIWTLKYSMIQNHPQFDAGLLLGTDILGKSICRRDDIGVQFDSEKKTLTRMVAEEIRNISGLSDNVRIESGDVYAYHFYRTS